MGFPRPVATGRVSVAFRASLLATVLRAILRRCTRPHTLRLREVERRSSGRPPSTHPAGLVRPVAHRIRRCGVPLRSPSPAAAEPRPGTSPSHASTRLTLRTAPTAEAIGPITRRPAGRRLRVCPTGNLRFSERSAAPLGFVCTSSRRFRRLSTCHPHDAGTPCGPGSAREPRSPPAPSRGKPRSFALPSFVHRDIKEPLDVQV